MVRKIPHHNVEMFVSAFKGIFVGHDVGMSKV